MGTQAAPAAPVRDGVHRPNRAARLHLAHVAGQVVRRGAHPMNIAPALYVLLVIVLIVILLRYLGVLL